MVHWLMLTPQDLVFGGSGHDGAQVGRFSSWDTGVPKGFLAESAYFSLRINSAASHLKRPSSYKEWIRIVPKRAIRGEQCLSTDKATLYKKSIIIIIIIISSSICLICVSICLY